MLYTFYRVVCRFCRLNSSWDTSKNSLIFQGLEIILCAILGGAYAPSAPLWIRHWGGKGLYQEEQVYILYARPEGQRCIDKIQIIFIHLK